MFNKARVWIRAARLRTLPLSVSGILLGNGYSLKHPNFSWLLFLLMLCTAILFQIISNFANDYGDGIKGTDNRNRVGPKRTLQSGMLSAIELKQGIVITAIIALCFSSTTIVLAFGTNSLFYFILFIVLSFLCVWAAISYTVGKNAYGYVGLGDLFVFLFFGLLAVIGSSFVQLQNISKTSLQLSLIVGLLAVGVLNLNNMRDRENDAAVGKNTLAVLLGNKLAKIYHYSLLGLAIALILVLFMNLSGPYFWLPITAVIPLLVHFFRVYKNDNPKLLDPELKTLALSAFVFSALSFLTFYMS